MACDLSLRLMGRSLPSFRGGSGYPSIVALSINPGIDVMGQKATCGYNQNRTSSKLKRARSRHLSTARCCAWENVRAGTLQFGTEAGRSPSTQDDVTHAARPRPNLRRLARLQMLLT